MFFQDIYASKTNLSTSISVNVWKPHSQWKTAKCGDFMFIMSRDAAVRWSRMYHDATTQKKCVVGCAKSVCAPKGDGVWEPQIRVVLHSANIKFT